jgi:glycopeptide antibiotics resistance protein
LERALALGVSLALGWELAEYVAFIRTSPELGTAYTDTLGDLTLGTTGSIVAALAVWFVRSRPRLIERLRRARLAS